MLRKTGSSGIANWVLRRTFMPSNSPATTMSAGGSMARPNGTTMSGFTPRAARRSSPYCMASGAIVAVTYSSPTCCAALLCTSPSDWSAARNLATPSAWRASSPCKENQLQRTSSGDTKAMTVSSSAAGINSDNEPACCHTPSVTRKSAGSSTSDDGKRRMTTVIPLPPNCAK